MGQRLIISEEEKINILAKHVSEKLLKEDKSSFIQTLYDRIKNRPVVKKIEIAYDPDLSKFVKNVVSAFPNLKKNESVLLQKVQSGQENPESFISNNQTDVEKTISNQIQEQLGVFVLGFAALILLILIIKRSGLKCVENQEGTSRLQELVGKTINLYNDSNQQMLYGKVSITDIKFMDCSGDGGRSHVIMNFDWRVECLSNPSRLDDNIYVTSKETVGKTTIKKSASKYNKSYTDKLQELVGQYCKKPDADFALQSTQNNTQNIA